MIPYRGAVHPEKSVPDSLSESAAMRRAWPHFFFDCLLTYVIIRVKFKPS